MRLEHLLSRDTTVRDILIGKKVLFSLLVQKFKVKRAENINSLVAQLVRVLH